MADNQKMYDRFSNDVLHMIVFAKAASIDAHVDCLYPESFLIGTLLTGENVVTLALHEHGVDLEKCLKKFKRLLANRQKDNEDGNSGVTYDEIQISKEIVEVCRKANEISLSNDHKIVDLGHLFVAIMELHLDLRQIINRECKDYKNCVNEVLHSKSSHVATPHRKPRKKKDSIISQYCTDMTEKANNGEFDPIISRDSEIEEAITILCRRNKSNPILIGEPGVGKTAIVEGISQRIVSNAVPTKLRGCKIYSLNMSGMVAGTKYRGDFEKRIQDLIKAVEDDPDCILFIDEIHTIVGAGGAGSAMDAANILKPALARKLKCIGATTHQEYKKHFQEDGALSRRFGVVNIDEPSEEDVKKIMMGIKERFEQYHECAISNDAIDSIIDLTKRYRPMKHFPDKAIDCMDTACAMNAWKNSKNEELPVINSDDIARVISKQCQVPIEVIMWDTHERIHKTEEFLKKRVIGQPEAVKNVCRVLRNAYSGVRDPSRPIGVLVFGGQSGTGKTYTSKQLSNAIFGNDKSLIKIDMSEYSEEHSMSKIIGSPPGYVGFKDVDVVVDKIKRRPYCILLLDEIEKAHPKVMKLFLQVMSEGTITSALGEKIDCKNIFFIMTGNFGMNVSKTSSMGFSSKKKSAIDNERERLIDFCKKSYGEEFVNRVDAFVPFMELTDDELVKIIEMRLSEFAERVNHKNIKINISDKVSKRIIKYHKEEHGMNAMAIDRIISNKVQPLVADIILDINDIEQYSYTLTIDTNKNNEVVVRKRKRKKS